MEYYSLISSLSKQDLKDLASQMRICCSGNKTELCTRVMKVVDQFDSLDRSLPEQHGGHINCNKKLPDTPEKAVALFKKMIKAGRKVDGRWVGEEIRTSTGYKDHTVYLEACENMVNFKDPNDLVSKFLRRHDINPGQDPAAMVVYYDL